MTVVIVDVDSNCNHTRNSIRNSDSHNNLGWRAGRQTRQTPHAGRQASRQAGRQAARHDMAIHRQWHACKSYIHNDYTHVMHRCTSETRHAGRQVGRQAARQYIHIGFVCMCAYIYIYVYIYIYYNMCQLTYLWYISLLLYHLILYDIRLLFTILD